MKFLALSLAIICFAASEGQTVTPKDTTLVEEKQTVSISCAVDGISGNYKPLKWFRHGEELQIDGEKYVTIESNNTLEIHNAKTSDAGEYECVAQLDNGQRHNATVKINARSRVKPFERSKNLVQDDPLSVTCLTEGYPVGDIKWSKLDGEIDFSDPRITLEPNQDQIANATLKILDLKMEDAGEYVCSSINSLGGNNATVTVRVKDKLAALWPFLGICAEVIILCVIIFVYERRRAKKMEEEEEREESGNLTNSHDHKGKDEIRQRK